MQSFDPTTLQPPEDPLSGFLPAGTGGSVLLTVRGKSSLDSGTVITNPASIVFDVNPAASRLRLCRERWWGFQKGDGGISWNDVNSGLSYPQGGTPIDNDEWME
jgi:hypothetical protein